MKANVSFHKILAAIGLVTLGAVVGGASSALKSAEFDTLTVKRINVVDDDGTMRLAIFNEGNMPPARVRGEVIDRSIGNAAGFVFFGPDGQEIGGMGSMDLENGQKQAAFIFDYTRQMTDGVSIGMTEGPDVDSYRAGVTITDRRPYKPGPIESSQGVRRVLLQNDTGDAQLLLNGTDGKPRIRIGVNAENEAEIAILDANGKVVRSLTE